jgi:hypothetical protein
LFHSSCGHGAKRSRDVEYEVNALMSSLAVAAPNAEAVGAEPAIDAQQVAVASEFQEVRRPDLHRARFGSISEMEVKGGANQPRVRGNERVIACLAGAAPKDILRLANQDLAAAIVPAIVPGDLELAEDDFADAVEAFGVQRIRPVRAQRVQGVGITLGEIVVATAQRQAELLAVEIAFAFRARNDSNFVVFRGIDDHVVAFRTEVEDFRFGPFDRRCASEVVAVADQKPVLTMNGIDLDTSRFPSALMGGEPGIKPRHELFQDRAGWRDPWAPLIRRPAA